MAIILIVMAGILAASGNFFFKKSIDSGGNSKAYLVVQLGITGIIAVLLNPVSSGEYAWDNKMAVIGLTGGVILGLMLFSLGKSLQYGPPGFTFAILNSSSVVPAIVMALLFGAVFGHPYSFWNGIGSIIVVLGMFWAGWEVCRVREMKRWALFISGTFLLHVLLMVFMQWRALLLKTDLPEGFLFQIDLEGKSSQWFMPMMYLSAFMLHLIIYVVSEKRWPRFSGYGLMGGIANGLCTFLLIKSTEVATSFENAMLFPIYSVIIVLICNSWGQMVYNEKVNWAANAFSLAGLLCGTINWKLIL